VKSVTDKLRHAAYAGWLACCCLAAHGCSFGSNSASGEQNTCNVDADCDSQHCEAGRCVTSGTAPLSITLEITPKRMPDGSQPFPIQTEPFALGARNAFALQLPITIPIRVRDGDLDVAAQVTFVPQIETQLLAKTTQVNTVMPTAQQSAMYVSLLSNVTYNVMVQPVDPKRPPHSLQFQPDAGDSLDIDYSTLKFTTRQFSIQNAPAGDYVLRARGKTDHQLLTNSVPVGTAAVTLGFDSPDATYVLELAPNDQTPSTASNAASCDQTSPLTPTLTIDGASLVADKKTSNLYAVALPTLADPVVYSGTVQLCTTQKATGTLTMGLDTTSLNFNSTSKNVTGSYDGQTIATWDDAADGFTFCTRVLPGDYVVVVTPPQNSSCEIFAERRLLAAASSGAAIEDVVLSLRTPASLGGSVMTPDMMPMANASIDLVALRASGIKLAENDPTVPTHNRSAQATTAADGGFKIPVVDVGTYDVFVRPPAQSNYAWRIIYDVDVGSRTPEFSTVVTLGTPVAVNAALSYQSGSQADQMTLGSADVHAYTIVDTGKPTARTLEVARGQADENGHVTLLIPSDLQQSWIPQ
jgi:hypothetical protein